MRTNRFWAGALAAGLVATTAVACGDDDKKSDDSSGGANLKGTTIAVAAVWTGTEQQNFTKVLEAFKKKTGANYTYSPTGDPVTAFLDPKIKGGTPPDVAILPNPGVLRKYAADGSLKALTPDVMKVINDNYTPGWKEPVTAKGQIYGVPAKAAYKSLFWYRAKAFEDAGVQPPATWDDLDKAATTLQDAGQTPFAIAGAEDNAWTLTDWFENVYLSQAGPEMYDKLAKHEIKWTDPSVAKALQTLALIWGRPEYIAGGLKGALKAKFEESMNEVFAKEKAAMAWGGDFAAAAIGETKAKVGEQAKTFQFPKVGDAAPNVTGGDLAVALKDGKGAMEFMKYLASPEAGKVWAEPGGYLSPNKNVSPDVYPNPLTKQLAKQMQDAGDKARYDLSDLTPASFGGTPGKGMWGELRTFLSKPSDVKGTQARLEAAAAKAYK